MARGSEIVVSANPMGKKVEGIIKTGETPKPGTLMQIDATVALVGGRHTWKAYAPGTDGEMPVGPFIVLEPDRLQGKLATDAYAAGDRAFGYIPLPGDELNLLFNNQAGTGDDIALGDKLIANSGTGKVHKTTGTPETEVAVALEAIVDPAADQLLWCMWSGY